MTAQDPRDTAGPAPLRYAAAARVLHWLVAVLVVFVLPLGFLLEFFKDGVKLTFYAIHETGGFLILWLMLARLAVRLVRPPPPHLPMPALQQKVADGVHVALYVCLLVQPVAGFLATNAWGFPFALFGVIPIPSPIGKSPDLAPILSGVHVVFGWAILVLFCLHFAGVLYHHIVLRDRTLERML